MPLAIRVIDTLEELSSAFADGQFAQWDAGQGKFVPAVSPAVGIAGTTPGRLDIRSGDADTGWHVAAATASFNGHPDPVLLIGWNTQGVGDWENNASHLWHIGLESDYWDTPTDHVVEAYFEFDKAGGPLSRRPFHTTVNHDTGACITYIAGAFQLKNSAQTEVMMQFTDGGGMSFYNTPGHPLSAMSHGNTFIQTMNLGGTGYWSMMMAVNDWLWLGEAGHDIQAQDDVVFYTNAIGPVLKDRANAHIHRLYMENDVLKTELVS